MPSQRQCRLPSWREGESSPPRADKALPPRNRGLSKARLAEMIEEATVDAHGDSEQATGWFTMIRAERGPALRDENPGHRRPRREDRPQHRQQDQRHLHAQRRAPSDLDRGLTASVSETQRQRVDRGVPPLARKEVSRAHLPRLSEGR